MAETLINSDQIRDVGDTSSETLLNSNQIRVSGDTSTKTLINSNQIAAQPILTQYYAYSKGNNTVYTDSETIKMSANLFNSSSNFLGHPQVAENEGLTNCTITGTLTNNNGVFSGFTGYDFIYSQISNGAITSSDIIMLVKPTETSGSSVFYTSNASAKTAAGFRNDKIAMYDGSAWVEGSSSFAPNTKVWARIKWINNTYTLYSLADNNYTLATLPDLSNWTSEVSFSDSSAYINGASYFGTNYYSASEYFRGEIDLKNSLMQFNSTEQLFYSKPEFIFNNETYIRDTAKDKMGVLPKVYNAYTYNGTTVYTLDSTPTTNSDIYNSSLSVVGKPTAVSSEGLVNCSITGSLINDYGIVSNFTQSSFVNMPYFAPSTNAWAFEFFVKTPSSLTRRNLLYGAKDNFYYEGFAIELMANGCFGVGLTNIYSGTWNIGWISGTTVTKLNSWYILRVSFSGTEYKLELKEIGGNWNTEGTISFEEKIYQNNASAMLGGTAQNADVFLGKVNIAGVKSTIDTTTTNYYSFGSLTYGGNTYQRDLSNDRS